MNEFIDKLIARLRLGWCRGHMAEKANGVKCVPTHPEAARWCLFGACSVENPDGLLTANLRERLVKVRRSGMFTTLNDHTAKSVEDIVQVLEKCKDASSS